jgi:hypothetical protein
LIGLCATAAVAQDDGFGPGLDTCLAAVLKERPGVVHGWKVLKGGDQESYRVSVIDTEGKIADTTCVASSPSNFHFKERFGVRRYESYGRIAVPEQSARATAPQIFVGPVRIWQMAIDLDIRGRPAFEYHLTLPNGREVVAQVDAITGALIAAELLPM